MKTRQWQKLLQENKVIAVIRAADRDIGVKMAIAAARGGMKLIEITWNSQEPRKIIHQLQKELPDCIIGTGTILTLEELKIALSEGIKFCFTPHVNLKLIQAAIAAEIPIIPGALTPTEIVTAWQAGANCVKVFPVQALGGVSYLKSLQGPLGNIPLIPTGGVTIDNAKEFINSGAIAVGLAGDLFPQALIKEQNWSAIAKLCSKLVKQIQS